MNKITHKTLAEKYNIFEEDIERIFQCYDKNNMPEMRSSIGYCFFYMDSTHSQLEFLFDIIMYIRQCQKD